jgi:hypothetical protein
MGGLRNKSPFLYPKAIILIRNGRNRVHRVWLAPLAPLVFPRVGADLQQDEMLGPGYLEPEIPNLCHMEMDINLSLFHGYLAIPLIGLPAPADVL